MTPPRKRFPHHVSLYLGTAQHDALWRLVERTGLDASKHLRRALALYLDQGATTKRPRQATPAKPKRAPVTPETVPAFEIWAG